MITTPITELTNYAKDENRFHLRGTIASTVMFMPGTEKYDPISRFKLETRFTRTGKRPASTLHNLKCFDAIALQAKDLQLGDRVEVRGSLGETGGVIRELTLLASVDDKPEHYVNDTRPVWPPPGTRPLQPQSSATDEVG